MLSGSIDYAIEAVWKRWVRWILLVVSSIIFPLMLGYVMEIYRGPETAPELRHWGRLFTDGLKLIAAWIIYMLPVIAVIALTGGLAVIAAIDTAGVSGLNEIFRYPDLFLPILAGFFAGIFIAIVLAILISLIATIGIIRMARTDRFAEAFNFGGILTTIRNMGWGNYIIAQIILFLVMLVFSAILALIFAIPYIGWIIYLFLLSPLTIFEARYLTKLYEHGETGEEPIREQGEQA